MRRLLACLALLGLAAAFAGCHHHPNSPVKKFLKKRHRVHTGQTGGN